MAAPLLALLGRIGPMLAKGGGKGVAGGEAASAGLDSLNKNVKKSGDTAKKSGNDYADMVGKVRQGAQDIALAKYLFTDAAEGITSKTVMAATALKSMADPFNSLVGLSNPAAIEQFNIAFNDTIAVMGRGMLPITEAMTRAMRTLGNAYARVEPLVNKVSKSVAVEIDKIFRTLDKMWKANGPLFEKGAQLVTLGVQVVGGAFQMFGKVLGTVGRIYTGVADIFTKLSSVGQSLGIFELVGEVISGVFDAILIPAKLAAMAIETVGKALTSVLKLLGFKFKEKKDDDDKSPFGASVRNVTIGNSAESIAKTVQEKAFSTALSGKQTETEPEILNDMRSILTGMRDKVIDAIKALPKHLRTALEDLFNAIVSAVSGKEAKKAAKDFTRGAADAGAFGLAGMLASWAIS